MSAETKLEYFPDEKINNQILSNIPNNRGITILGRNLYEIKSTTPETPSSYIYSVGEAHKTKDYSDVIIEDINNIIHKLNLNINKINMHFISEMSPLLDISLYTEIKQITGQYADRRKDFYENIMYNVIYDQLSAHLINIFKMDKNYKNTDLYKHYKQYMNNTDSPDLIQFNENKLYMACDNIYYLLRFVQKKKLSYIFNNESEYLQDDKEFKYRDYYAENRREIGEKDVNLLPISLIKNMIFIIILVPYIMIKLLLSSELGGINNLSSEEFIDPCSAFILKILNININDTDKLNIKNILNVVTSIIKNNNDYKVKLMKLKLIDNDILNNIKNIYESDESDKRLSPNTFGNLFYDLYVYSFIQEETKMYDKYHNFYCVLSGGRHTTLMDGVFKNVFKYTPIIAPDHSIDLIKSILKETSIIDTLKNYNIVDENYNDGDYTNIINVLNDTYTYGINSSNIIEKKYINTLSDNALPSKNGLIYKFLQNNSQNNNFTLFIPNFYKDSYKTLIKLLYNCDIDRETDVNKKINIINKYNQYKYEKCVNHLQSHTKCKYNLNEYYNNTTLFTYLTKCPMCTLFDKNTIFDKNNDEDTVIEHITYTNEIYDHIHKNFYEKIDLLSKQDDAEDDEYKSNLETLKEKTVAFLIDLNEDKDLDDLKNNGYSDLRSYIYLKRFLEFMGIFTCNAGDANFKSMKDVLDDIDIKAKEFLSKDDTLEVPDKNNKCVILGGNINALIINIGNIFIYIIICVIIILIYYIVKEHIIYKKYNRLKIK